MKKQLSSDLISDLVCLSGLTVSPDELLVPERFEQLTLFPD